MPAPAPLDAIDTLFLDVGNTLISIDFAWVAEELSARSVPATAAALARAEAAARPGYSRRLFVDGVPAGTDLFRAYLVAMLERLPQAAALGEARFDALVTELRGVLRPDGRASTLWRCVMPGVVEALARLQALGLKLVVVSNSDGTVEHSLVEAGLRQYLTHVVDSAIAGHEKPDPRIFRYALAEAAADPARTAHIGDLYHADVLGARGAGVHALLLDPYGDWRDVDCAVARDLSEVAELIETARASRRRLR
jgi:putative hydrolase of the HAD superfamily